MTVRAAARESTVESAGQELAREIEDIATSRGVDIIGYGDMRAALPKEFAHLPIGISLGIPHPAVSLLQSQEDDVSWSVLERALCDHRDVRGQGALEDVLKALAELMRARGYRYFCCPPESDPMDTPFASLMLRRISHKAAATCAGLGWVGRHGLLIHSEHGPLMTWATLVTDAPLSPANPVTEGRCGDCTECVEACPGKAIQGRLWTRDQARARMVHVDRCREILDEKERTTGRRICGKCAVACAAVKLPRNSLSTTGSE